MISEGETISAFVKKQRELIQIEREEEETQLRELLRDTKVNDLVKFGLCFKKLKIKKTKLGAFDRPIVVFRPLALDSSKKIEDHPDREFLERLKFTNNQKFSRGDLVALYSAETSREKFSEKPLAVGSLEKVGDFELTVVFSDNQQEGEIDFFSEEAESGMYCLVQTVNDVTYRRYNECLKRLDFYRSQIGAPHYELLRVLFGLRQPMDQRNKELVKVDPWFDNSLNEWQKLAVQRSLTADYYSLIHGPPGTGKTKTVCEVIQQLCHRKQKVLVTGASNIAVDNIIERLEKLKSPFKIIRIGNPTRTLESSHKYSLDFLKSEVSRNDPQLKKIKAELKKLSQQLVKCSSKKGTDFKSQRRDIRNQMRGLSDEMYHIKGQISIDILKSADVIVSTQTSSYDDTLEKCLTNDLKDKHNLDKKLLDRVFFDCVILDEAAQSLSVSSWMPILMGKKAIFAGDHKQLPPTVKSEKAERQGFGQTLFEELANRCEASYPELITLLKTQYRMNEAIMDVSSAYIYGGELVADKTVREHSLADISKREDQDDALIENSQCALIWVDTAGAGFGDSEEDKGVAEDGSRVALPAVLQTASKYNEGECELVSILYKDLRERQKLSVDDIGVIAPYKAQVDLIRNTLTHYEEGGKRCEVSTVDGFQGREKEVIIMSLTRANPKKEIGFLADVRRLNVAITRPKRLLIIIGDSDTVATNDFIKAIYNKVRECGQIMSVYDLQNSLKMIEDDGADELRKHFNTGTYLTQAHFKVKDSEQKGEAEGEKVKKKDQAKRRKKSSMAEKPSDKKEEAEKAAQEVPALPNLFNNPYSIDNDLYEKLQELLKTPSGEQVKVFRKLEHQERRGLESFIDSNRDLEMKINKKPRSIVISHRSFTAARKTGEQPVNEDSQSDEAETDKADLEKEEEKQRKLREKRQRQKEAKKKKKEEEKAIAEMDEDEYFEMLEKEKEQRLADQKFCPVMIGNTGKKCLKNIQLLGIVCKFCENKFCTAHAFATMHGCDDAEERFYEQQRRDQIKGRSIGSSGQEPQNEAASAYLQAKLRRMREEEAQKRMPKAKDDDEEGKGKGKKPTHSGAARGGRGGRGGKKPSGK